MGHANINLNINERNIIISNKESIQIYDTGESSTGKSFMEISEKLVQYRHHIAVAIAASVSLWLLLYVAPRTLTILAYFWPLFASTTVFLVAIIAFGGVSNFADSVDQVHAEKAGQELLDYVSAGRPEPEDTLEEPQK